VSERMIKIHDAVNRCKRCAGILDESHIIPRSGFPPEDNYSGMVIGCEPGPGAKERLTPEQYKRRFDWQTPSNTNTVRLLFKAIHEAGVDWNTLFYTNTVKCPATPSQSRKCYVNCQDFLQNQIKAIKPHVIVVFGSAADRIGIPRAAKGQIIDYTFEDYPCIITTHPQGAYSTYLAEVAQRIRNKMFLDKVFDKKI